MITTFYPPYNFGGDGIYVQRLANELARRGHHVDVIHCIDTFRFGAAMPSKPYQDHPNVTVHGLRSPLGALSPLATQQTGYPLLKSKRIRKILEKGFDVIHYHNISTVGGPKILDYGQSIKLYTMHDYWLVCPTHALFRFNREPCPEPTQCLLCTLSYKRLPQWWRYTRLLQEAAQNVDAFIAPFQTVRRKHLELGFEGRVVLIPNFVSMGYGEPPFADDSLQPAPERPYFLFVGRLEKLKGLHTVIPLFQRYGKAQLRIAGTGTEENALRRLGHGSPNIRFLGNQSGRNLQTLYRQATALLYPTVNFQTGAPEISVPRPDDGFGAPLVIMEAFSEKTPAIVSKMGRIPALMEDTGGGLVYSNEQELVAAMDQLVTDSSLRNTLGLSGFRAYRQNWTADAHLGRYFALIREIAATRLKSSSTGCAGSRIPHNKEKSDGDAMMRL